MNRQHILAQALLRAWPFPNGSGRLVDRLFSNLRFSSSYAQVRTADGFDICVNPNDLIGKHIYLTGRFDHTIVQMLYDFAEPGDTLLDVGANIGYVSACFAHNVSNSYVVAVEPQAEVLALLRRNLPENSMIVPFALSDHDGEVCFELNAENSGAGRIVSDRQAGSIRVPTKSAKSLFSEVGRKIDLVKIDAEGHEKTIISACLPYFEAQHPRAILFEDAGENAGEISAMLSEIGYTTWGIKKSLLGQSLVEAKAHDYIAISDNTRIPDRARRKYSLA